MDLIQANGQPRYGRFDQVHHLELTSMTISIKRRMVRYLKAGVNS